MRTRHTARAGLPLLAAVLAACEPPPPASIEIHPGVDTADAIGAKVQFTARVYDERGDLIPDAEIVWSVVERGVATISPSGLLTVTGPGEAAVVAVHGSLTNWARMIVRLRAHGIEILAGDRQRGTALRALAARPVVFVHSLTRLPIADVEVEFVPADNGHVAPRTARTDARGEASTTWILGPRVGIQTLKARAESHEIEFSATATHAPLRIPEATLSRGRLHVPYRETMKASGGSGSIVWSIETGSLPAGLALDTTGVIAGTPEETGEIAFTVRARDSEGNEAAREMRLLVCEGAARLAPGEVLVDDPVEVLPCPVFLPAGGEGDRYRVAVVRTDIVDDGARTSFALKTIRADIGGARPAMPAREPPFRPPPEFPPALAAGVRIADESSRMHERLLADAERLIREYGSGATLPDTRSASDRSGPGVAARKAPPPDRRRLRPYLDYRKSCEDPPPALRAAMLVGYNDHLAIYQDSIRQARDPIRAADAETVLDYYDAYGASTIEEYFGGVPDINGDERANVFVSPVVPDQVAAFVWAGDFLSSEVCSWSNEMELIYFNRVMFSLIAAAPDSGHYQALPTMVHEVKHLGSLYTRTLLGAYQPRWVEEGTAEIAAEISSRKAMEAVGGVARGARLDRDAFPPREDVIITPENYGVLLRLARMTLSYSGVLNSISVNPTESHHYYGTSWHFHRFLGDAWGDAAARADGAFFTALNDGATPPGARGIEVVTGRSLSLHMEDYAAAMMLNGSGAPEPDRGFTTYDFPSATWELLLPEFQPEGIYPWVHTGVEPLGFENAIHSGTLAPGGIRFHDLQSDGTGRGIELELTADGHAVRMVVARIR